jgi:hypothetical protein
MTINEVLPLVHGMDIRARDVLPDSKNDDILFFPSTTDLLLVQLDGTFQCVCGEQVSRNLTESQAAELMKQKMSGGYEWRWRYTLLNRGARPSFTVTFGRDGRVNHITDVYTTDVRFHPM